MSPKTPTTWSRFGQQNPGALLESRITGGARDELRQQLYDGDLLVAVEDTGIRKNLNTHVIAVNV